MDGWMVQMMAETPCITANGLQSVLVYLHSFTYMVERHDKMAVGSI